jgi:hypothetical protein
MGRTQDATLNGFLYGSCVVGALVGAALLTQPHGPLLIAIIFVAGALLLMIRRWGVGFWHALLVLAVVDALPGPNVEAVSIAHANASQVVALVLTGSLIVDCARPQIRRLASPGFRLTLLWAGLYFAVCVVAAARGYWIDGETPRAVFKMASNYFFLPVLVPLFVLNLREQRRRSVFLVTCGMAAVLVAVASSVQAVSGAQLTFLVHQSADTVGEPLTNGLARVYSDAGYLVTAAIPLALGQALFGQRLGVKRIGWAVLFVVCVVASLLGLTRALYVGLVVGLAAAVAGWLVDNAPTAVSGRRQVRRSLAVVAVAILALITVHPRSSALSTAGGVVSRAGSTLTSIGSTSPDNDVQIRLVEANTLEHILGGSWLFGIGDNSAYFPGLPNWSKGSIRNSDVGVLNVAMISGVTGAILEYIPFILVALALLVRRRRRRETPSEAATSFGVFGVIITVVVGSPTLVMMFSLAGSVVCAAVLGLGIASLTTPDATNLYIVE